MLVPLIGLCLKTQLQVKEVKVGVVLPVQKSGALTEAGAAHLAWLSSWREAKRGHCLGAQGCFAWNDANTLAELLNSTRPGETGAISDQAGLPGG